MNVSTMCATCALLLCAALAACSRSAPLNTTAGPASVPPTADALTIRTLSNRADLLSDGNALVQIVLPAGADARTLKVELAGRDVSAAFAPRADGRILGLVEGLALGDNTLSASVTSTSGTQAAQLTLTNHPRGGPVFSGTQLQPYVCNTESNGLGTALDAQCNGTTTYELMYYSSLTQQFSAYDPAAPANDVANITTDEGKSVPYIVRVETGTLNRGIYKLAVLFDPTLPTEALQPWSPPPAWNRKVMWIFGGGTAPHYTQDPSPSPLDDTALSRGFMVATGGLNVHGNNSNDNVSAESILMLKEHIAETYGPIRYTIGEGCSGGGLQQYLIAAQYPGLLDGLIPNCSYPDTWTTATEVASCVLLNHYFLETSPQLWAVVEQQAAVMGHSTPSVCIAWEAFFGARFDPTSASGCNLPEEQVYNAQTNPNGVRCTLSDHQAAVLGTRVPSVWGPVEQQLGRGFANRPLGNVGVQFGLRPYLSGLILPEQFVDMNEKIGGIDIDGVRNPARTAIEPGTSALAYRGSFVSDARQLAGVPIIDLRGNDDVEIHTNDWSYAMRARLDRHNGSHDNQVIFTGALPLFGDLAFACAEGAPALAYEGTVVPTQALCTHNPLEIMDRWLAAIEADGSDTPLPQKVKQHKPADAVDTCFVAGQPITNTVVCDALYPRFTNPLVQAGGPLATDNIECQLKPLVRDEYASAAQALSDAQFARLQAVFPQGVCDWSKPAVGEQASIPWLDYSRGPGGEPLGPIPVSQPLTRH